MSPRPAKKPPAFVKRGARFAAVPGRALRDTEMTPKLREVLMSVCYYASADGTFVAKIRTLAAPTGTDERNMRGYLKRLEELGYLLISERVSSHDGRRLSNAYRVLYDADIPAERDRSMGAGETSFIDLDEVGEDEEQTATGDGEPIAGYPPPPGNHYPVGGVLTTMGSPGSDGPGTSRNTVSSSTTNPPTPPAVAGGDVGQVWAAYQQTRAQVMGERYRAQSLTAVKRRLISQRIVSHGFPAVLAAVRGWRHDAFVAGENDKGQVYGTLEHVLRVGMRGDNIERFSELHDQAEAGQLPAPRTITGGADAERAARIKALMDYADGDDGEPLAQLGDGAA